MENIEIPKLYKQYFVDKSEERKNLFKKLVELYKPRKGLYPGSFVHITPSFYIQEMTYIDSDKRIRRFFEDENVRNYITRHKAYDEYPVITAFQADYSSDLPIDKHYFDILFSFYAGFISQSCKKYLGNAGLLVCNNSHGDASIAYTDNDYRLMAVIIREGINFSISDKELDHYFIKKDGTSIDTEYVLKNMKGEKFTREAYAYLFAINRNS
jgi:hypothetical protein